MEIPDGEDVRLDFTCDKLDLTARCFQDNLFDNMVEPDETREPKPSLMTDKSYLSFRYSLRRASDLAKLPRIIPSDFK